jgi:hypothetical protein
VIRLPLDLLVYQLQDFIVPKRLLQEQVELALQGELFLNICILQPRLHTIDRLVD